MTLPEVRRCLQLVLIRMLGSCPLCGRQFPNERAVKKKYIDLT